MIVRTGQPLNEALARWTEADDVSRATAFDMVKDMSRAWYGVMGSDWANLDKVKFWSLFLVMITVMGRLCCVTTYAPVWEDTIRPTDPGEWDKDGLPAWIEVGWRSWKSRKPANRGQRYGVRLHRNYLDPRFCAVTWLLMWKRMSGLNEGKLWGDVKAANWKSKLLTILRKFMGITKATTHSVRRSAAQWAARCGDRGMGIKNAGRWISFNELMKYVDEGAAQAAAYVKAQDPIFTVWVFKPVTSAGTAKDPNM